MQENNSVESDKVISDESEQLALGEKLPWGIALSGGGIRSASFGIGVLQAINAKNFTQCDSLLIGDQCGAHTVPYIEVRNPTAQVEHEASTSKVSDEQLFYCQQRGISMEDAHYMIVNGFCRSIFQELPFEFAMEAGQLLKVSLEGAVG